MDIPAQAYPPPHPDPRPYGGWPGNGLEEVLSASLGVSATSTTTVAGAAASAGARIVEVLGRSLLWIPLPNGGGPRHQELDLPTLEVDGQAYVPVFSSEQQFLQVVGGHMAFTVAPAVEFARGLPPAAGLAVNPDGAGGVLLPPAAVAELCRAGRSSLDGPAGGGRVRLFKPDWQEDPLDFLAAAGEEFAATGVVLAARRCLASIEGGDPVLFVGVELVQWEGDLQAPAMDALGRALGRAPVGWPVNLVLLDVTRDPVADWLREQVSPFYVQGG